jgi:chromate transporter
MAARVMKDYDDLGTLFGIFAPLSLIAIGGINSTLPEMHRFAVEIHQWMLDEDFVRLYAISQAAPGPNLMIVTLIGWHVAGTLGGLVSMIGIVLPSAAVTFFVARAWTRFRKAHWRKAVQAGMIPITLGLVAASAFILVGTVSKGNILLIFVTLATALVVTLTRIHPLIPLAAAGALGYFGAF